MYEIFMTSIVESADLPFACAVLEGICSMQAWESVARVLYFQGPSRPVGLSNLTSVEKPIRKGAAPLWRELHQSLSRQSFIVQARYELVRDRDFGVIGEGTKTAATTGPGPGPRPPEPDATPGILRWADFPDPPQHGKPVLTQRKVVELWEQRGILSVLRDNQHRFKGEVIEEVYRFFRDDVEFSLTKQYIYRPIQEYTPLESRPVTDTEAAAVPVGRLPAWEDLTPVDRQGRWLMQVRTHVLQDNKPDEVRKAQDRLLALRQELEGVFDFRVIDRKAHDTRVVMQQQGVQALPQKVVIGKG